jgi:hypothetical protein
MGSFVILPCVLRKLVSDDVARAIGRGAPARMLPVILEIVAVIECGLLAGQAQFENSG